MSNPKRLAELRSVRDEHLGGALGDYADLNHVKRELDYARRIFSSNPGWSVIKVADKPIEEIASEILNIIQQKKI